jgi:pimeloyl-ACP methyl ester carboxylesterase
VEEFMAAHGLEAAAVIGHSLGGKTAMQFALQFPERVEKLVIADMAPRAFESMHAEIFIALLALDLPKFQTRQQIEDALAPEIPNLVLRRFLLKNLGRNTEGRFCWKINLPGLAENSLKLRAPISHPRPFTKPALFIRGGKSDYINPEDKALIRQLFLQAEIQTIIEAGHWVHADRPEDFLRLILKFFGAAAKSTRCANDII